MSEKSVRWRHWITETVLQDIQSSDTPDPVPFFDTVDSNLETSEALGKYKWGKNDGDYLYLLYLLDKPAKDATEITPVYIGESNNISTRIGNHSRKIRAALPTSAWKGDGDWGSFSKYDHIALIQERTEQPLYVWIVDVDELEAGPYGYPTYRQELEAKLVGLVHAQSQYERISANREFVPNRILYEIGKVGPNWVTVDSEPVINSHGNEEQCSPLPVESKADRWYQWVEETIIADIQEDGSPDPIPLFAEDELEVQLTEGGVLKRSAAIDEQIRRAGLQCVDSTGVREGGCEGLLYMMYQLDVPVESVDPGNVIPRYIGKAEAYGKKRQLSSNFVEIAKSRNATRSFARWGDGNYWHIGEISMALRGEDDRKAHWAETLFESGTRTLKEQTYLWVHAWNEDEDGPYGVPATLAEVEPLLIGLAYEAYPEQLLNKSGTPDDAPMKTHSQ
ncbi:GIY-YIG nuclease family protein [Haladaptatus caseinilyticus]|uniref:GIY-YIG nuclease family protein n=1 Tax=Haladaptatus caseinilyticus TaxID=2993314 RepID=UPI00224A7B22|nr:GIY-YIG nuclease family protein [Haladaptatus caseinilyticus]